MKRTLLFATLVALFAVVASPALLAADSAGSHGPAALVPGQYGLPSVPAQLQTQIARAAAAAAAKGRPGKDQNRLSAGPQTAAQTCQWWDIYCSNGTEAVCCGSQLDCLGECDFICRGTCTFGY